jgi:hypothetical protein
MTNADTQHPMLMAAQGRAQHVNMTALQSDTMSAPSARTTRKLWLVVTAAQLLCYWSLLIIVKARVAYGH